MALVRLRKAYDSSVPTGGCTRVAQTPPHDGRHLGVRDLYANISAAHVGSTGHYVPVYSPQEEWRGQGEYYRELFFIPHLSSLTDNHRYGVFPSASCLGYFHFSFYGAS